MLVYVAYAYSYHNEKIASGISVNCVKKHPSDHEFTSQTLLTSSKSDNREERREKKSYSKDKMRNPKSLCVFCGREHPSKICDVVTKPEVKKSISAKEKRCFVFLSVSHQAGDCKKKWKCFKCVITMPYVCLKNQTKTKSQNLLAQTLICQQ